MTDLPLISCLMVTRGHLFPARFAIDCYRRQTYRRRELVVVCERADSEVRDHVDSLGDASIRYIEAEPGVLGALRNRSVGAARGELVAQWDDDDLYHPRRLELQAAALAARDDAAAHFLARWYLWWPARRLLALSGRRVWEGSMLARRRLVPPYPALALREDSVVTKGLFDTYPLICSDLPELYCYVVHGGNSWDEEHFDAMFGLASELYEGARYESELARLALDLPAADYELAWTAARA